MLLPLLEGFLVGLVGLLDRHLDARPAPARRPGGARLLVGVVSSAVPTVLISEILSVLPISEGRHVDQHFLVAVRRFILQLE